jgi:serine-type D-Ala-D-Ala carboxypeptidase/endopeptidase (penicillin-binding protein 4)
MVRADEQNSYGDPGTAFAPRRNALLAPARSRCALSLARGLLRLSLLTLTGLFLGGALELAFGQNVSSPSPPLPLPAGHVKPRADELQFRARAERILSEAAAQKALWGILIVDRDTGETLYDLNADKFFTPASNAKIFTTVFALATLGPSYQFRTTLESSGGLGPDGRLNGDLALVGRGDPDLSNWKLPYAGKLEHDGPTDKILAELADAAVAKGLREVEGDVVGDDSYFPYDPYPAGWNIGDQFFAFGAPVSAIAFNENCVGIEVMSGARLGDPATFTVDPPNGIEGATVHFTTSAASDNPDTGVGRQPGENFVFLRGTIPLGHSPLRFDLAMTDPAGVAAHTLRELLEARGVRVSGSVRIQRSPPPVSCISLDTTVVHPDCLGHAPPYSVVLAEHLSPPLIESVRLTNKVSQNLHAELFLRTVAREEAGYGATDVGLWLERDFLKTAGIADGDVVLSDGSGLSSDDLVTPRAAVEILRYALRQAWGEDFASSLPVAGVDGTLENRMKDTPANGLLLAKTGTLEHVHSLCGYATTLLGEHVVFAMFGNNNPQKGRDSTRELDALAVAMVETLGLPTAKKKKR